MSASSDFEHIEGRLMVTNNLARPEAFGRGPAQITGTTYLQGPVINGDPDWFPTVYANMMISPLDNVRSPVPVVPGVINACIPVNNSPYSLCVIGDAAIFDNCDVNLDVVAGRNIRAGRDIIARGNVKSQCGKHVLSRKKNFDIPHPSREGWRLRHTCPEGPSNDVYIRGKVINKTEIELPTYWKDFVDIQSITVSLTPIGAHQHVIVKRIDENKVYLQSNGGIPINCHYHIFAERKDGEKLIPEYKGKTPSDYPGNNSEYSVSGYHYDVKEN